MLNSFEAPIVEEIEDDGSSSFSKNKVLSPEEQKQSLKDKALFSSLKNLPRTTYDQRKSLYTEVEDFLFRGFISESVCIHDIPIALRTLSANDLFFMRSMTYPSMTMGEWKLICLAKSIWMWDGYNLLGDPNAFNLLRKNLNDLSPQSIDYLYSIYIRLLNKENENRDAIDLYSLEFYSRRMWAIYKKYRLNSVTVTGIEGTENISLNMLQKLWILHNQTEDAVEEYMNRWDLVKASMSPHAHKQIKQLNTRDEAKKMDNEKRKQAQLDHFYYRTIGMLKDQEFIFKDALTRLKTIDELNKEYENWVDGVKDSHDLIVEQWKLAIANKMKEEEERIQAAQSEMFKIEYHESDERPKIVAYTTQQLIDLGIIGKPSQNYAVISDSNGLATQKSYIKKQFERDGTLDKVEDRPKIKNNGPRITTLDKINKLNNE